MLAFFEFGEADGGLLIAADFGVAEVFTGEEDAAGGGADGAAGVGVGEPQTAGGELVDVRGGNMLLAVTAKIAVAEIVRQDKENIGRGGGLRLRRGGAEGGEKQAAIHEIPV